MATNEETKKQPEKKQKAISVSLTMSEVKSLIAPGPPVESEDNYYKDALKRATMKCNCDKVSEPKER